MSKFRFKPFKITEKVAAKAADKMFGKLGLAGEITQEKVAKACKLTIAQMDSPIGKRYGLLNYQVEITKGMYDEVTKLLLLGDNSNEIFNFYWDIPEFKQVWSKLNFDEDNLRAVIHNCLNPKEEKKE